MQYLAFHSIPGDNNSTLIPKPLTRPCNTVTGDVRNHGDVWRSSACQSCTCQFGQIHCFSQMCPMVNCEKTLLRKGQCCPSCLGKIPNSITLPRRLTISEDGCLHLWLQYYTSCIALTQNCLSTDFIFNKIYISGCRVFLKSQHPNTGHVTINVQEGKIKASAI